jgi:hypothetical protein
MKAIVILLLSSCCVAQEGRVSTVTRTVKQFGDLERQLQTASDANTKSALMVDDFEERVCSAPGVPIPRAEWLAQPASQGKLTQEAVHEYGPIAIYSALRSVQGSDEMLVDTWRQEANNWKLAVRYRCPASGTKPESQELPKRY